jgi:AcrR family transcriptional regulator
MGYRHTRDEILEGAVAVAFADGLSTLTFGRVATYLGTSDRIVVYYFPTKDDLVTNVLVSVGTQLQATLSPILTTKMASHVDLARAAWPILATPDADPIFALFFEALGLAASGREPYRSIAPSLVTAWIEWMSTFLSGSAKHRRSEAEAAVALLDGLLLVRQMAGPVAAERAAKQLGVATSRPAKKTFQSLT